MKAVQSEIISCWMETGRLMRKRMISCAQEKQINPSQIYALMIVQEHPQLTMKEFAQHMMISSPSATSLVNRLVKMGYIQRKSDPKSRKLVRLVLSAAGTKMLAQSMKAHTEEMAKVLNLLNSTDQTDFARILRHLRDALAREHM